MKKTVCLLSLFVFVISLFCCSGSIDSTPIFKGFVIESGMQTENNSTIVSRDFELDDKISKLGNRLDSFQTISSSSFKHLDEEIDETSTMNNILDVEMLGNKGEKVVLTLQFINPKRDTFVELVLNDSDYGINQLYSSQATTNKVISVDTYFSNEMWITDIVILMPVSKTDTKRVVEITDVVFLRNLIDDRISASLDECDSTFLEINIISFPVETSYIFFDFEENEDGYTVTRVKTEFGLPKTLFIPSYYKGIPVTEIGYMIYWGPEGDFDIIGIPDTTIRYNGTFVNVYVRDAIYIFTKSMSNMMEYGDVGHQITPSPSIYIYHEFLNCDMGKALINSNESSSDGYYPIFYLD